MEALWNESGDSEISYVRITGLRERFAAPKYELERLGQRSRYGLDSLGFEHRRGKKVSSPKRPDWLRGPTSPLFSAYRGSSPGVQ